VRQAGAELTLNDNAVDVLIQPYVTLLDALREDLELTGPKEGCGHRRLRRVHRPSRRQAGRELPDAGIPGARSLVRTIEGLDASTPCTRSRMRSFRLGVPQCGFCIPGVLMAAAALLAENPRPTEEEIRYGIAATSVAAPATRR